MCLRAMWKRANGFIRQCVDMELGVVCGRACRHCLEIVPVEPHMCFGHAGSVSRTFMRSSLAVCLIKQMQHIPQRNMAQSCTLLKLITSAMRHVNISHFCSSREKGDGMPRLCVCSSLYDRQCVKYWRHESSVFGSIETSSADRGECQSCFLPRIYLR